MVVLVARGLGVVLFLCLCWHIANGNYVDCSLAAQGLAILAKHGWFFRMLAIFAALFIASSGLDANFEYAEGDAHHYGPQRWRC